MQPDKYLIGLAGEMRVCAELLKKGYTASITFGNAKATDIIITGSKNLFLRIEVKTSKNGRNFVTGYFPKYTDPTKKHPDVWVFYLPDKELSTSGDRFFIATHEKVGAMQLQVNKGVKTEPGKGCDNIPRKIIETHKIENQWDLFQKLLDGR
ncbi:MAG: hypothetical protein U9N87_12015 [Planctomycetota bacterium]|nr:hypothetical protein [Planctomycetota bacterium]